MRTNTLYKRSLAIRLAKRILFLSKSLLPEKWYKFFYSFVFQVYKRLIRVFYLRFLIYYKVVGNKEKFKKSKVIYTVMPYSLVGIPGLYQTYDLVLEVINNDIRGDFVECGVAQGGSAALIALVAFVYNNKKNRKLYLFDSFEGLPHPTDKDFIGNSAGEFIRPIGKGSCLGIKEQVENLFFSKLKIDKKNVEMAKGWFQNTLPEYKNKIDKISLLRIDADWYESTKCCLENLYDKVTDNGFVIIDDYGTCYGAKRAVDDFLQSRKIFIRLIHDGRGGCYFKKPLS